MRYELSNHLGNVLVTISDKKLKHATEDHYYPDVITFTDYYAFGMAMPNRTGYIGLDGSGDPEAKFATGGENHRYAFNGKEADRSEWNTGTVYDYGFRIYDPRICKFLSVDPLEIEYPWFSSYHFAGNSPIAMADIDGREPDEKFDFSWEQKAANKEFANKGYEAGKKILSGSVDAPIFLATAFTCALVKGLNEMFTGYENWARDWKPIRFDLEEGGFYFEVRSLGSDGEAQTELLLATFEVVGGRVKLKSMQPVTETVEIIVKKAPTSSVPTKSITQFKKGTAKLRDVSSGNAVKSTKRSRVAEAQKKTDNPALWRRPKIWKSTKEKVKANAEKAPDGRYVDGKTGEPIEPGQEVLGHKRNQSWDSYQKDPNNQNKTRKEVIKDQNNPDLYEIEDAKSNSSNRHTN